MFIQNNYAQIKESNPQTPFIIRECHGASPAVFARYAFGVEKKICLENKSEQEVDQELERLVMDADSVNAAMPGGN